MRSIDVAKKLTRAEARAQLSDEEKIAFDELCDEVIAWSKIYYGVTFVSYVILMELVKSGWSKKQLDTPKQSRRPKSEK